MIDILRSEFQGLGQATDLSDLEARVARAFDALAWCIDDGMSRSEAEDWERRIDKVGLAVAEDLGWTGCEGRVER